MAAPHRRARGAVVQHLPGRFQPEVRQVEALGAEAGGQGRAQSPSLLGPWGTGASPRPGVGGKVAVPGRRTPCDGAQWPRPRALCPRRGRPLPAQCSRPVCASPRACRHAPQPGSHRCPAPCRGWGHWPSWVGVGRGVQGLSWEGSPGRWWHRCEPGVRRGPVAGWRARAVGQGGGCGWRRGPLAGPDAGPPSLSCWCRASWEAMGFRRLGARLDWFGAPRLRREGGAGDPAPPSQARSAPWALPLWRRQSGGVSGSKQGSQVR